MAGITAHNPSPSDQPQGHGHFSHNVLRSDTLQLTPSSFISVDESDDFFDPFSKLNLYLLKKVKQAIDEKVCSSDPLFYCERQLMQYIAPQFRKEFPNYQIGAVALKKVWETAITYYNKVKKNPHLLNDDKTVSINALIRDAIDQIDLTQISNTFHPYTFSHKIAKQVAQCCYIINGELPSIPKLAQLIWTTVRHLIPRKHLKQLSVTLSTDIFEKKLVHHLLHLSSKTHSQEELETQLQQTADTYLSMLKVDQLHESITTLGAETLKSTLKIFSLFSKKTLLGIETFLEQQIHRYLEHSQIKTPEGIVMRVISLYRLTAGIEQTQRAEQLEEAIEYIEAISSNLFTPNAPNLNQSIYAFINSEIVSTKRKLNDSPFEDIIETLENAYDMTTHFPKLNEDLIEELSIWIHTLIAQKSAYDLSLSNDQKDLIVDLIMQKCIENPNDSFETVISEVTVELSKILKVINSYQEPEQMVKERVHILSQQNDMSANLFSLPKTTLSKFIKSHLKSGFTNALDETVINFKKDYLKQHPQLKAFCAPLNDKIVVAIKQQWYGQRKMSNLSPFQLFNAWHKKRNGEKSLLKILPLFPEPGQAFCYSYSKK